MKLSKIEITIIFLSALFAAFGLGWFSGQHSNDSQPYLVTVEEQVTPTPSPTPVVESEGAVPALVWEESDTASVATQEDAVAATPTPTATPMPGILEGELININTAPAEDLERLSGIGTQRAQDIIAYRTEQGPFATKEELTNVSGIGEATLAKVIDYITVE